MPTRIPGLVDYINSDIVDPFVLMDQTRTPVVDRTNPPAPSGEPQQRQATIPAALPPPTDFAPPGPDESLGTAVPRPEAPPPPTRPSYFARRALGIPEIPPPPTPPPAGPAPTPNPPPDVVVPDDVPVGPVEAQPGALPRPSYWTDPGFNAWLNANGGSGVPGPLWPEGLSPEQQQIVIDYFARQYQEYLTRGGVGGGGGFPSAPSPATSPPPAAPPPTGGIPRQSGGIAPPQTTDPFPPGTQLQEPVEVGTDPLSTTTDEALLRLLEGGGQLESPLRNANEQAILDLLENRGALFEDPQEQAMRLEAARGPLDRLRQAQLAETRAALADRGQLVTPFEGSGPEAFALGRIEERLAPFYAEAGQQIGINELERQEARLQSALVLATGLTSDQTRTLLDTIRGATDRQEVISNIALGVLDRNMAWNMFLAQFGLQRDEVMNQIRSGNLAAILPILSTFIQAAQTAAGGFVGPQ